MKVFISSVQREFVAARLASGTLRRDSSTGVVELYKLTKHFGFNQPKFNLYEGIRLCVYRRDGSQRFVYQPINLEITQHDDIPYAITPVERLISVLEGEMNRDELLYALGLKDRNTLKDSYLNPAMAQGLVELTIPDKPTSKHQRYQLTAKGKTRKRKLNF